MSLRLRRIYDSVDPDDGQRILVDRVWPRGVRREDARLDAWMKDIAPSTGLRKWFGHDRGKWSEFRERYFGELEVKGELIDELLERSSKGTVTLLYAAKDEAHNNAVALAEYLATRGA